MDQDKLTSIRAALETERDQIAHQLEELGAPTSSSVQMSVDEGFADSGQATAERSEVMALVEELRGMHTEVLGALERIEAVMLGSCEKCCESIPL